MTHAPYGSCPLALSFRGSAAPGSASTFPCFFKNFLRRCAQPCQGEPSSAPERVACSPKPGAPAAQLLPDHNRVTGPGGSSPKSVTLQPRSCVLAGRLQVHLVSARDKSPSPAPISPKGVLSKTRDLGGVRPNPKLGNARRRRRRKRRYRVYLAALCALRHQPPERPNQLLNTLSLCVALSSPLCQFPF